MAKKKQKKNILNRPPIVTIMGHVDHGKTTLLDTIRKSAVADSEHGGITQHIGAYQISHDQQPITFIDTPGHAAFSQMRARGAQVTDIVILVVAADDGVKPQTVESIQHLQAVNVPVIVAINKIDLPQASADMVKAQLTEHSVFVEGYGGQTPVVEISAKSGKGLDKLLETILILAELEEVSGDISSPLEAIVIESHLDKSRGSIATLIVKNGCLKQGQDMYFDDEKAKVRAMFDDKGNKLKEVRPGDPAQVLGFKSTPEVGVVIGDMIQDKPNASENDDVEKEVGKDKSLDGKEEVGKDKSLDGDEKVEDENNADAENEKVEDVELDNKTSKETIEPLKLVVKADTAGTLEAIIASISQEEVNIISAGIGLVGEADVLLAHTTGSEIISFNVIVSGSAKRLAGLEKVSITSFEIIYKLLEYIEGKVLALIEPTINEEEVGEAKIAAVFEIRGEKIAGCEVVSGKIEKKQPIHLLRKERNVGDSKIKSLKQGKEDIKTAKAGKECGIILENEIDFRVGDMIKSYRIVKD